ncbi:hypothetical protein CN918_27155 [Priestia megaterium]|nr:hypothetical protein CN918_27155 [Priestia megaterium]
MKKSAYILVLGLILVLCGCGKTPEQSDKKDDIGKMIDAQRSVMKASDNVNKIVLETVKGFDGQEVTFDTLKNVLTANKEEQNTLRKSIQKQSTTELRTTINDLFVSVIDNRIKNYNSLLEQVRLQDEKSLQVLVESIEKKDVELEQSVLTQINEQLKKKKVKQIDALKK